MERKYIRPGIKLNIFGKLLIGIIAMILLIALIAQVGIKSINKLEETSNEMMDESIKHYAIQKLKLNFQQILMPANDYLIHGNKVEQSNFGQLLKEVKVQIAECRKISNNSREQILIEKVESSLIEIEALAWDIFQLDNPIGHSEGAIMMEEMDAIADKAISEIDEVLIADVIEMEEHIKTTQTTNNKASRTIIIVGFFISDLAGTVFRNLWLVVAMLIVGGFLFIFLRFPCNPQLK